MNTIKEYIKAVTAHGGDDFDSLQHGYTEEGRKAFEAWLDTMPRISGKTLYRGYCFDAQYWNDSCIKVGSSIVVDNMTQSFDLPSFTTELIRAATYMNEFGEGLLLDNRQKVLFRVETSGKYFVDISEFSHYPEEREARCVRDTALRVTDVKRRGGYVELKCTEL